MNCEKMKKPISVELEEKELESVSGGVVCEVSVCRQCGAVGNVVSETQLCETCHNAAMYEKWQELLQKNHIQITNGSDPENKQVISSFARGQ